MSHFGALCEEEAHYSELTDQWPERSRGKRETEHVPVMHCKLYDIEHKAFLNSLRQRANS